MKSSCIAHRPKMKIAMLKEDFLQICDGDIGASVLLAFFEYWHNFKLDQREKNTQYNQIAEKHGDPPTQDVSLYQFHTAPQIYENMMGLIGRKAIESGIEQLVGKGFISIHKNPNPRYSFDSTRHFLLHPEIVNESLGTTKLVNSDYQNGKTVTPKGYDGHTKTAGTSPKSSSETTPKENIPARPKRDSQAPDPQVKEFLDWYFTTYQRTLGVKLNIQKKDGRLVKHLLCAHSLEEMKANALRLMESTDSFLSKTGRDIGMLSSMWNKLTLEGVEVPGRDCPGDGYL